MSIRQLPDNRLRLECDGPKCTGGLYELDNTQQAMMAANEWLGRRGWRTVVTGNSQEHFCPYCATKDPRFNPRAMKMDSRKPKGGKERMTADA